MPGRRGQGDKKKYALRRKYPLIGSVIGLLIGAFSGAFLMELAIKKKPAQALRAGWGTFTGRIGGILTKVILGIVMIVLVLARLF